MVEIRRAGSDLFFFSWPLLQKTKNTFKLLSFFPLPSSSSLVPSPFSLGRCRRARVGPRSVVVEPRPARPSSPPPAADKVRREEQIDTTLDDTDVERRCCSLQPSLFFFSHISHGFLPHLLSFPNSRPPAATTLASRLAIKVARLRPVVFFGQSSSVCREFSFCFLFFDR